MSKPKGGSRSLVPDRFSRDRKQVLAFIRRGRDLAEALGAPALLGEIEQLAASAVKPFLFVVVGEVKSGKSSLINALLEAPVCGVDSAPCTDRVQEINYGEEEQRIEVSELEERLHLPHAILRHIAIVDTPGTNSIVRRHQHITENYIPQSDLILFVFFAKNPYTGSAWEFLRHIKHDWQRNTLFVLQQADLLEKEELERTLSMVKQQLAEEGIAEPRVFAASVLTGEGVGTLRDYLRTAVVKGRQFNKNISLTHNLLRFLHRLDGALEDHACLLRHDEELLGESRELVLGADTEAQKAYDTLAELARGHAETALCWLDAHLGGARMPVNTPPTAGDLGVPPRRSPREHLRQAGRALAESYAVRDALSGGWETPLRVAERFNQLQGEFNRCLFRGELRSLELGRHHKQRAEQLLDAIAAQPACLSKPLEDRLARQRLKTLRKARHAVEALAEPHRDAPVSRPPSTRTRSRWSVAEHLVQVGASLGSLLFGYYVTDLFSALLFGLTGYLGAGYGLAVRHRKRVGKQARTALARSLAQLEQRLHSTLLAQPNGMRRTMNDTLNLWEANLLKRRAEVQDLRGSIGELRQAVEHYESAAWLDAVQGED